MNQTFLESGRITHNQLILMIIGFIIGDTTILMPGKEIGHDAWLAILLAMLIGLIFAGIYLWLTYRFPGKNLVEIHELVYGKILGAFFSLLYIWFLFHTSTLVTAIFSEFFTITMLPETPNLIVIIAIIMLCIFAVRSGLEPFARCSVILVPIILTVPYISSLLLISNFDLHNYLPFFEKSPLEMLKAVQGISLFPFGETIAFLMIFPYVTNFKRVGSSLIKGIVLAGLVITSAAIRNIGVLGSSSEIYTFPSYQVYRLLNLFSIITQLEILTSISVFILGFVKIVVLLYGAILGTRQLFKLRTEKPLFLPFGILAILLTHLSFSNIAELNNFAQNTWRFYAIPFEIGIPVLTLTVALIRKLPRENSG